MVNNKQDYYNFNLDYIPASGQFLKVWKKLLSTLENALQSLFNQASMLSVSCPLYLLW
jgi:hypothetical protein